MNIQSNTSIAFLELSGEEGDSRCIVFSFDVDGRRERVHLRFCEFPINDPILLVEVGWGRGDGPRWIACRTLVDELEELFWEAGSWQGELVQAQQCLGRLLNAVPTSILPFVLNWLGADYIGPYSGPRDAWIREFKRLKGELLKGELTTVEQGRAKFSTELSF